MNITKMQRTFFIGLLAFILMCGWYGVPSARGKNLGEKVENINVRTSDGTVGRKFLLTASIPDPGRMTLVGDLKDGRATGAHSITTKDTKTLIAYSKNTDISPDSATVSEENQDETDTQKEKPVNTPREKEPVAKTKPEEKELPAKGPEKEQVNPSPKKGNINWLDKGMLCSTYGNHKAAIEYFTKAIALAPQNSMAYFNQGISYGELGEYNKAIASIDKALELSPEDGMYLYGRGRVYLLAGYKDEALEDFKRAAALGNNDAREYLETNGE